MADSSLIVFILAGLALNITPGPDMMFIITKSVAGNTKSGVISSLGIASGSIVHTLLAAFGFSAVLIAVPAAYEVIKYTGAAYLVYLGIKVFLTSEENVQTETAKPVKMHSVFVQAMFTNIFNPKVALFFLAFIPQFITPGQNVTMQFILLGLLFNLNGTIVNITVAVISGRVGSSLKHKLRNSAIFKWITSSVFIGLGVRLALMERK